MRTFVCAVVATAFAFAVSNAAFAAAEPGQGYLTIMGTYLDDDTDRGLEDAVNGGMLGAGYAVSEYVNVEGYISFAYPNATAPGVDDAKQQGLGVDLQGVFRRGEKFSPYLVAGVGNFKQTQGGVDREGIMFSWGAGFYLDLFASNVALRGEAKRRVENSTNDGQFDNLFSLGLQIPFGAATPKWVDSDGDGVEDGSDRCPNTLTGAVVDAFGCELDSDGDGVKDSLDKCPGTLRGVAVDSNGCEPDDDGDGVVNRLDECPGTPAGVQVDIKGCEIKAEIRLEGVNFESNSDRLLDSAYGILNDAAATLVKNPSIKVEVAGHTDSDGAAAYNEDLSARRARTVRDYLASKGVAASRLTARGYGESQPVADNSTSAGKAQNRRVVLRITER